MRVAVAACRGKPQRQAPKIRRAIAAARAPFVQQRDGLPAGEESPQGARAQQLSLGATPAVGHEPRVRPAQRSFQAMSRVSTASVSIATSPGAALRASRSAAICNNARSSGLRSISNSAIWLERVTKSPMKRCRYRSTVS